VGEVIGEDVAPRSFSSFISASPGSAQQVEAIHRPRARFRVVLLPEGALALTEMPQFEPSTARRRVSSTLSQVGIVPPEAVVQSGNLDHAGLLVA